MLPETNYKKAASLLKKKYESIKLIENTPFRNQDIFKKKIIKVAVFTKIASPKEGILFAKITCP